MPRLSKSKSKSRKRSPKSKSGSSKNKSQLTIPYVNFGLSKSSNEKIIEMMEDALSTYSKKKINGTGLWISFYSKLYKEIPEYRTLSEKKVDKLDDKIEDYCNEVSSMYKSGELEEKNEIFDDEEKPVKIKTKKESRKSPGKTRKVHKKVESEDEGSEDDRSDDSEPETDVSDSDEEEANDVSDDSEHSGDENEGDIKHIPMDKYIAFKIKGERSLGLLNPQTLETYKAKKAQIDKYKLKVHNLESEEDLPTKPLYDDKGKRTKVKWSKH